jgi:hypothetical protein
MYGSLCGLSKCNSLWGNGTNATEPYSIYRGDYNTIVRNSTGTLRVNDPSADSSTYFCGKSLGEWRELTKGDAHTAFVGPAEVLGSYTPEKVVAKAREMLMPL